MATAQMNGLIQRFRRAALLRDGGGLTDGQLLDHFLAPASSEPLDEGDEGLREAAFASLVRRHGPMVLGVCRRILNNTHDAEDAFQATFLVLVRKAASLRPRDTVGNWLYGVAYHTALKARARGVRRRFKEAQVKFMPRRDALTEDAGHDWQPLLDQELSRLPDKYREPVVLCELEGKTRKEAARHLGLPEGTLSGRLTTARRMLAKRLARRGVVLSAGALAAALSQNAASACVPVPLAISTAKAAALLAAGTTATGVISANVAVLTEGVMKAMLMSKLKVTAAFLTVVGLAALGSGPLVHTSLTGTVAAAPLVAPDDATLVFADEETANQEQDRAVQDRAAQRRAQARGRRRRGRQAGRGRRRQEHDHDQQHHQARRASRREDLHPDEGREDPARRQGRQARRSEEGRPGQAHVVRGSEGGRERERVEPGHLGAAQGRRCGQEQHHGHHRHPGGQAR